MDVQQRRRLRRLVPDQALIRRRAAGEPLRELASDYDVAHTTLGRYFERPEVQAQLREAARQLKAEQRALARRQKEIQRREQDVRRRAKEQAAREREQARRQEAALAAIASRRRPARTGYERWLDERDSARPLTRAERHSMAEDIAARVVASGGGMQAVMEATGARTLEHVVSGIDPAILAQALDNDLLARAQLLPPER